MKGYLKVLGIALLVILTLSLLGFVTNVIGLTSFAFFSPKVEQVRYNTFKESQSYNDGMLRDLQELKRQYITANPDQKQALRSIVLQRFSVYPMERMPADLQSFYQSINEGN